MLKSLNFHFVILGIASLMAVNSSNAGLKEAQINGEKLQAAQSSVPQQAAFDALAQGAPAPEATVHSAYSVNTLDVKAQSGLAGIPTQAEQILGMNMPGNTQSKATMASVLGMISGNPLSQSGQIATAQAMTAIPEVKEFSFREAVPPMRLVIQSAETASNNDTTEYNLASETQYVTDEKGRTVKAVTANGNETKEVMMDPVTGAMTGAVITTKTDESTKMSYFDANWKPTQTIEEKATGERLVTSYTVDPATGNVAKAATVSGNKTTEISYDPATNQMTGAMIATTEAESTRQEYYNADWKPIRTIEDKTTGPEQYRHSETTFTLDETTGNPVKSEMVSGDKTTVVNFDPATSAPKDVVVTTKGTDGTKVEYFDGSYHPTKTTEDKTTGPEQYRHSETTFERDPGTGVQVKATTVSGDKTTVLHFDSGTGKAQSAEVITDNAESRKQEQYSISQSTCDGQACDVWTPTKTIEDKKVGDPDYTHVETTFTVDPATGNLAKSVAVNGDKTTEIVYDPATKKATSVLVTTDNSETTKKEYYTGDWKPVKTIEDKKSGPADQRHSETVYQLDPATGNPVSATKVSGNVTVVQNFDPQQPGQMLDATMTEVTATGKKVTQFNGDWQPVLTQEYTK